VRIVALPAPAHKETIETVQILREFVYRRVRELVRKPLALNRERSDLVYHD